MFHENRNKKKKVWLLQVNKDLQVDCRLEIDVSACNNKIIRFQEKILNLNLIIGFDLNNKMFSPHRGPCQSEEDARKHN